MATPAVGEWRHQTPTDGAVPVPCPATTLALDDVYRGIQLDPADAPRAVHEP